MKAYISFILLMQGMAVTLVGVNMLNIIATVWLADVTGRASLVGLILLVSGAATGLANIYGGVLADRYSRKSIIVLLDFINAILVLSLGGVFYLSDDLRVMIFGLFTTLLLLGIVTGLHMPAFSSLMPNLLPASRLSFGNMIMSSIMQICGIVGKVVGGSLITAWGVLPMLIIISIGYILSAISEWFIRDPRSDDGGQSKTSLIAGSSKQKKCSAFHDIREGLVYVFGDSGIRSVFIIKLGNFWCAGLVSVTTLFLIDSLYGKEIHWYGYFMAAFGAGVMCGSILGGLGFNRVVGAFNRSQLYATSMMLTPLLCMSLACVENIYIAISLIFLLGICFNLAEILTTTQLQLTSPSRIRGRVMSVSIMFMLIMMVSASLSGALIDLLNGNTVLAHLILSAIAALIIYPSLTNKLWLKFIGSAEIADSSKTSVDVS